MSDERKQSIDEQNEREMQQALVASERLSGKMEPRDEEQEEEKKHLRELRCLLAVDSSTRVGNIAGGAKIHPEDQRK